MVYPIVNIHELRSPALYRRHQLRATPNFPVFGIKGESELSQFFSLPVCIAFDVMHLVFHGISKSFLSAIINKKVVDIKSISRLIENAKVPHDFKRKPRNVSEISLWKSQEHKNFLFYIGPSIIYLTHLPLFSIFYLLSVAVFVLSSELVRDDDVQLCFHLLIDFQKKLKSFFGASVQTMSLHALYHLPEQVKRMGPLSVTSASTFENLNRVLKRSVTGTKGQAHQMITRFLHHQSLPTVGNDLCRTRALGRIKNLDDKIARFCMRQSLPVGDFHAYVNRFYANGKVFHSADYGKYLSSASYYAYVQQNDVFVKIKYVFKTHDTIRCVCRNFTTKRKLHQDEQASAFFSQPTLEILDSLSPYFILEKSDIVVYDACCITHHAIVRKSDNFVSAVKVVNNWEHE